MYNIFDDPFFKDPIFRKRKGNDNDNDNVNDCKCEKRFYVNGKEVSEEEYKKALNPSTTTTTTTTTQDVDIEALEKRLKALRKKIEEEKQSATEGAKKPVLEGSGVENAVGKSAMTAETPFIIFSSDPVKEDEEEKTEAVRAPWEETSEDGGKLCCPCGDANVGDGGCDCGDGACQCELEPAVDETQLVNGIEKIAEGVAKIPDMPIFYLNHYVGQNKMRDEVYLPFAAIDKDGYSLPGITDSQLLALLAYRFRKSEKLSKAMANLINVFYDEIK